MPLLLPLIFLSVPLIEIALFILIGGQIGVLATMAMVVLTAMLGTVLLRQQGFAVLADARRALDQGRLPIGAVADGLFLLAAGLLLLTPGFFTDLIGFLLFIPRIRAFLGRIVIAQVLERRGASPGPGHGTGRQPGSGALIIEGEIVERHDAPPAENKPRR